MNNKSEKTGPKVDLTYDDYIGLETLLSLQKTLTPYHDELIFLVYHQQTELWFSLIIHEIKRFIQLLISTDSDFVNALDAVKRINRYLSILINSFDVLLEGISTEEFLIFRKAFGSASGFQSVQFRIIEILIDLKCEDSDFLSKKINLPTDPKDINHTPTKSSTFYWENAYHYLSPNQPTTTLINFKNKYQDFLNDLYQKGERISLISAFYYVVSDRKFGLEGIVETLEKLFIDGENKAIIKIAEELIKMDDSIIQWKRTHLKAVAKHMSQVKYGTGQTECMEYLKKSIVKNHYFPELYLAKSKSLGITH